MIAFSSKNNRVWQVVDYEINTPNNSNSSIMLAKFISTMLIVIALASHFLVAQAANDTSIAPVATGLPSTISPSPPPSPSIITTTTSTSTTTTTTTTTTNLDTTKSPTTQVPTVSTTNEPANSTGRDIDEARRKILQHIAINHGENRLALNRPILTKKMEDFSAESIEARVADSTTQFGLNFLKTAATDTKENLVISPLSLQNLLNMVLLGSKDNSATYIELVKALGYDKTNLLSNDGRNITDERLKPHQAMKSIMQSILSITHVTQHTSSLLNTDADNLKTTNSDKKENINLEAYLQTSANVSGLPLTEQLNFTLANLVLTNRDKIDIKSDYEKDLTTYYDVKVEQFSSQGSGPKKGGDPDQPLHQRVNDWVKKMTQNQIEKLANEGDLSDNDLIMVLLNAAHFKGRWLHTFSPRATHEGTFYNNGNDHEGSRVQFMRQKGVFGFADFGTASLLGDPYFADSRTKASDDFETVLTEDGASQRSDNVASDQPAGSQPSGQNQPPTMELSKEDAKKIELTNKLNCSALMLPFSLNGGHEMSMVILLPAKRDGIAELQASLTGPILNEIYKMLSEQQVQVELPKFTFEASIDAKANLLKLGVQEIFRDTASLDNMFTVKSGLNTQAKVDKIIHKAKISVDETGAEAAAASMASIVLRNFIRPPTPVFVADHPFIFVIRHNRSNMPLFMGLVNKL